MRVLVTGDYVYESNLYNDQKVHTRLNLLLALADSLDEKLQVVYGCDLLTGTDNIVDFWVLRRQGDVLGEQLPVSGSEVSRIVQTAALLGSVDFWLHFGPRPEDGYMARTPLKPRVVL